MTPEYIGLAALAAFGFAIWLHFRKRPAPRPAAAAPAHPMAPPRPYDPPPAHPTVGQAPFNLVQSFTEYKRMRAEQMEYAVMQSQLDQIAGCLTVITTPQSSASTTTTTTTAPAPQAPPVPNP